ncbi:hypothetical protein ACWEN3_06865 [Streptomyces sp. NPDC004561]
MIVGQSPALLNLYRAAAGQHLGNEFACLGRWREAEEHLRQALALFEAADIPAWSAPTRLDLSLVLHHLARYEEARQELIAARDVLTAVGHPRALEAQEAVERFAAGSS